MFSQCHWRAHLLVLLAVLLVRPGAAEVWLHLTQETGGAPGLTHKETIVVVVHDQPAAFGPSLSPTPLEQLPLWVVEPNDACQPLINRDSNTPRVALIMRHQLTSTWDKCTPDVQVMHAQLAHAAAVIVYDTKAAAAPLVALVGPPGHLEPTIRAVSVDHSSGRFMLHALAHLNQTAQETLLVTITPLEEITIHSLSKDDWIRLGLGLFVAGVVLLVGLSTVYVVMRGCSIWRAGHVGETAQPARRPFAPLPEGGMTKAALRALPVLVYCGRGELAYSDGSEAADLEEGGSDCGREIRNASSSTENSSHTDGVRPLDLVGVHAGATKYSCGICLMDYEKGDQVRVLRCYHRFHMHCVDQWFATQCSCPNCKEDATVEAPRRADRRFEDSFTAWLHRCASSPRWGTSRMGFLTVPTGSTPAPRSSAVSSVLADDLAAPLLTQQPTPR